MLVYGASSAKKRYFNAWSCPAFSNVQEVVSGGTAVGKWALPIWNVGLAAK